jgi:glycosyltransferase involved in cell wall biosynthesis
MPKFSVVIPCFNAVHTIKDTIASIQAQSLPDWEIICVDDGSRDKTREIIANIAMTDPRIRLFANAGKGPSTARNAGALIHASGDLIAFCDADDQWTPDKLAQLKAAFGDTSIDGAYGQIGFFEATPSDAKVFSAVPGGPLTIKGLLGENPACTMSNITVRRRAFARSGGFDGSMVHNEDLEWLIRSVGLGARIIGLPLLQTWYRTSLDGLSTDLAAMLAGRTRALHTAAQFGVTPDARSHAIHHRYLARRALRTDGAAHDALGHTLRGLGHSPAAFFSPLRRGTLTLLGAVVAPLLPRILRRTLFS